MLNNEISQTVIKFKLAKKYQILISKSIILLLQVFNEV